LIEYPEIRRKRRGFARRNAIEIFNDELGSTVRPKDRVRMEKERRDAWMHAEKFRRLAEEAKRRTIERLYRGWSPVKS
jgi:DNA-directed RNA polymerase subunit F